MPIAIGTRKKVEKYYLWQSSVVSLAGKLPMKDTTEDSCLPAGRATAFSLLFFYWNPDSYRDAMTSILF
jgi:hypothetical protein